MDKVNREELERLAIQRSFPLFVYAIRGKDFFTPFHLSYYKVLDAFAKGKIKKLIITVPPQHGKSEGSTRLLPAFMLGVNPDLKIAIASYGNSLAKGFNRSIQRTITGERYGRIFKDTKLNTVSSRDNEYAKNSNEFEVIGHLGGVRSFGRKGSITGNTVDVFIMDDLYKDAAEGNSPTTRDAVWESYTSAVTTRLHNNSQELIVFTRWNEDDVIGRIESKEKVIELKSMSDIVEGADVWYKLNFEAIKESEPTELDPRAMNEPLWGERHSLARLESKRRLNRLEFDCMYQGAPASKEGLLYGDNFGTYKVNALQDTDSGIIIVKKGNYTDSADTGDDYLCSICYDVSKDKKIYITDILYTQEPMEITQPATASLLNRNNTRVANIESNNGGRAFAIAVAKLVSLTKIEWFHQSQNKEARILTNSATVLKHILMPEDWKIRWPQFYLHITGYKRVYRTNKYHDCADVLTGIVEDLLNEGLDGKKEAEYLKELARKQGIDID